MNLLLVDGNNILKRSSLVKTNLRGEYTKMNGVYYFFNTIRKAIEKVNAKQTIIFWDGLNSGYYKHKIYEPYKANRKFKSWTDGVIPITEKDIEDKKTLKWQKQTVLRYLNYLAIPSIEIKNIEGDDLIGYFITLYKNYQFDVDNDNEMNVLNNISIEDKTLHVNDKIEKTYDLTETVKEYDRIKTEYFDDFIDFENLSTSLHQTIIAEVVNNHKLYDIVNATEGDGFDLFSPNKDFFLKSLFKTYREHIAEKNNILEKDHIYIFSSDGDFAQLITDDVTCLKPEGFKEIGKDDIGYNPNVIPLLKGMFGDTSDNIENLRGFGEVSEKEFKEKIDFELSIDNIDDILDSLCTEEKYFTPAKRKVLAGNVERIKKIVKITSLKHQVMNFSEHKLFLEWFLNLNKNREADYQGLFNENVNDGFKFMASNFSYELTEFWKPYMKQKNKFQKTILIEDRRQNMMDVNKIKVREYTEDKAQEILKENDTLILLYDNEDERKNAEIIKNQLFGI